MTAGGQFVNCPYGVGSRFRFPAPEIHYRHQDAWDEAAKAAAEIIGEDAMAAAAGGEATDKDPIPF